MRTLCFKQRHCGDPEDTIRHDLSRNVARANALAAVRKPGTVTSNDVGGRIAKDVTDGLGKRVFRHVRREWVECGKELPLFRGTARHNSDSGRRSSANAFDRYRRQHIAVDDRLKRHARQPPFRRDRTKLGLDFRQGRLGQLHQCIGIVGLKQFHHRLGHPQSFRLRKRRVTSTALGYGFMEESLGTRHGEQATHGHAPGAFAKNGDVGRVAAKRRNVVSHPFERCHLVQQPFVTGSPNFAVGGLF